MFRHWRMQLAAVVAFLLGMPLSERVFAQSGWDIAFTAVDLGFAIADASAGES